MSNETLAEIHALAESLVDKCYRIQSSDGVGVDINVVKQCLEAIIDKCNAAMDDVPIVTVDEAARAGIDWTNIPRRIGFIATDRNGQQFGHSALPAFDVANGTWRCPNCLSSDHTLRCAYGGKGASLSTAEASVAVSARPEATGVRVAQKRPSIYEWRNVDRTVSYLVTDNDCAVWGFRYKPDWLPDNGVWITGKRGGAQRMPSTLLRDRSKAGAESLERRPR